MERKIRPFLKWAGGKYELVEAIRGILPPAGRLIEPFVGSGAVFLNTNYERYVLNDINSDLISLFQTLQSNGAHFIADAKSLFRSANNSSRAYYGLRDRFNGSADPYERSVLFLYLNRHGYNGLCRYNRTGGFNVPFGRYKAPRFPEEDLYQFCTKARRAIFVCEDYRRTLARARRGHVVYCDPPYVPLSATASFTAYAAGGFDLPKQARLAEAVRRLADRGVPVLVSNHDTPLTQELYAGARISAVQVRRNISCDSENRHKARELLAYFLAR